jgi:hypothetical protein
MVQNGTSSGYETLFQIGQEELLTQQSPLQWYRLEIMETLEYARQDVIHGESPHFEEARDARKRGVQEEGYHRRKI